MKHFFLVLFVIICGFEGKTQIDTLLLSKNIYAAEDSMIALFKRRDWKTYANYMNPVVITIAGGKEGFVQILQQQMKILDNADMQIYKVGKILQLLKLKDQYQCIVESFIQMKINETVVSGSSYDIAISGDGDTWTFFRISETVTTAQIRQILPDLSPDFKFPRSQMQPGKTLEEFMSTYDLEYLN